jgi:multisubunit Na+/H+ antiporter MnhG subunit
MSAISYPYLIVWAIGAILSASGLIHISAPRRLREVYERWEFPTRFYLVVGVLDVTAAAFLALPGWRSWGIALAAFIIFGTVITLFNHRRYMSAVPGVILMFALVPASFAVPHETNQLHYVNTLSSD